MSRIDFGNILRQLRRSRDETLEQVSEATGLSVAMLSRVERGERLPSPESVEALAKHFGLSADYLMSETIAHRLVNRYGEESASRTAEHMTREQPEAELLAEPMDEDDDVDVSALRAEAKPARQARRDYGPFQQRDVLAALGAVAPAAAASRRPDLVQSRMMRGPAMAAPPSAGIDPTTAQVIRAATEASEAAAALVRREAPSLPREARLELVDRVAALAGQAAEALQVLARDPDGDVREAARRALRRLTRI